MSTHTHEVFNSMFPDSASYWAIVPETNSWYKLLGSFTQNTYIGGRPRGFESNPAYGYDTPFSQAVYLPPLHDPLDLPKTERFVVQPPTPLGQFWLTGSHSGNPPVVVDVSSAIGAERLYSMPHPLHRKYLGRKPNGTKKYSKGYRDGGPFWVWKRTLNQEFGSHLKISSTLLFDPPIEDKYYDLKMAYSENLGDPHGLTGTLVDDALSKGAQGWNKFKPGAPLVNLGQFLNELHRLPTIPFASLAKDLFRIHNSLRNTAQKFEQLYRDVGNEYLNAQFGWVPFLKDIKHFVTTTADFDRQLKILARDNGKYLHRKGLITKTRTVDSVTLPGSIQATKPPGFFVFQTTDDQDKSHRVVTTIESRRYTFSGSFSYFVPDMGTIPWQKRMIRKLYSLEITPDLLWEVLPWSWLADWFTNIGDILSNMNDSAAENLVANYAFVMGSYFKQTNITDYFYGTIGMGDDAGAPFTSITEFSDTESLKTRHPVTSPFGFDVSLDSLSGFQKSILGALAVSKIR